MQTTQVRATPRGDDKPWYRQGWPWFLIAFPATAVIAGFITLWLAVRSWDGLVVDDYYQEGKMIEQTIGRTLKAREMGLVADLDLSGESLSISLAANPGVALPPTLAVMIAHPTRGGQDQKLVLARDSSGRFSAPVAPLSVGRWLLVLEDESRTWRMSGDIHVPDQVAVRIAPPQD